MRTTPVPTPLREELAEVWRFRELLKQMLTRELAVRYKNSVFGFLWSIVPPLLQVFVYTFVFRNILKNNVPNYSAYLLCALIPWTFTQSAILDSSQSLLDNMGIMKKVYLPHEIIPLARVASNFVHLMVGWIIYFLAFFVVARIAKLGLPFHWTLLYFPLITLVLTCFILGMAFFISALNVFYEDVKFIVQTLFGLLLFLMPVFYPVDLIYYSSEAQAHPWLFKLYMLNPVAACINAYSKTILEPVPYASFGKNRISLLMDAELWRLFAGASVISFLVLWGGYAYFNRVKWKFVER